MHLGQLLAEQTLPPGLDDEIAALVERKSQSREMGSGPIPSAIADYIDRAFADVMDDVTEDDAEARRIADAGFREIVANFAPA